MQTLSQITTQQRHLLPLLVFLVPACPPVQRGKNIEITNGQHGSLPHQNHLFRRTWFFWIRMIRKLLLVSSVSLLGTCMSTNSCFHCFHFGTSYMHSTSEYLSSYLSIYLTVAIQLSTTPSTYQSIVSKNICTYAIYTYEYNIYI